MRQQSTTAPKRQSQAPPTTPAYLRMTIKPAMGDSVEVMELYYQERIQSFSEMLEQLNVLEDAPEIEFLCREIIEGRTMLTRLSVQKSHSA